MTLDVYGGLDYMRKLSLGECLTYLREHSGGGGWRGVETVVGVCSKPMRVKGILLRSYSHHLHLYLQLREKEETERAQNRGAEPRGIFLFLHSVKEH